ncbi:MAG: long-chain fatty acid--CoA ligase [Candidatus Melainabacteria bacterium]|nr:long-chain fatty acid--CoA ligase [Candidatus Melainabacteria bacterium]
MKYKSLAELFLTKAQRFGEKVLVRYFKRSQRELQELTWIEILEKIEKVSLGLERLGAKPKENIGLLSITCHDWLVCDFAILCLGACTVPLYHNSSAETIEHITIHASLRYVLVRNKIQLQKLRANFHKFPLLEYVIVMEDKGDIPRNEPKIITLDDVIRIGEQEKKKHPDKFRENIKAIQLDDLATIIYTSGTTGIPKGVPLTHKNVLIAALSFFEYVPLGEQHVQLTFLPLAHVFERICGQIYGIDQGVIFTYCEQPEQIPYLLKNADITMMLVVPRILEKIYAKVMNEIAKQPEMMRKTIRTAIDFGVEFQKKKVNKKPVTFLENLAYSVAKSTILNKIKQNIAPKLSIFVTGGAPLSSEISFFFEALGITVLEGYGLTETTAPLTVNPLLANKPGTVGIPFGHFKLKIADDGEIICQGAALFQGYYKDEQATHEAIIDGWFHTGDLGEFDQDGYLKIVGRKKDLLITAGGKNIAPSHIEHKLMQSDFINQIVVVGDRERYLAALIVPDRDMVFKWAKENNITIDFTKPLQDSNELIQQLEKEIYKFSAELANYESVKKFALLDHELTIDSGELTPTLKVKRKFVMEKYADKIRELFL